MIQTVKRLPTAREIRVHSLGREDPLEKERATPPVSLPRKSHGQKSLVGKRVGHDLVTKQQQIFTEHL